jgi:hypothetical protein
MCACKEIDVRETPNDSTLAVGEGHSSHGEIFHPLYAHHVSSTAEHPFLYVLEHRGSLPRRDKGFSLCHRFQTTPWSPDNLVYNLYRGFFFRDKANETWSMSLISIWK